MATPDNLIACYEKIGCPPKEELILIGDSLSAYIQGGINFNVETIWFNKNNEPHNDTIKPTYTVNHLKEIENIL